MKRSLRVSAAALLAAPAVDAGTAPYPDEAGFQARRELVVEALTHQELAAYRRGWFTGGDPGKYLPAHAMARLLRDRADADSIRYMNDGRSPKEHYHFAAVNWARFLPMFRDVLTDATVAAFEQHAARAGTYCATDIRGTENHHVMQLTSGVVLPDYVAAGRFGGRDREGCRREAKRWLRWYVKGLYARGQGEWDSSSYLPFDINGMLNVHDFSKDEECRLLARAALDWYAASLALKYVNGMHTGPKERGWTSCAFDSGACLTGWLWWGATAVPETARLEGARTAIHPATSNYRPNAAICSLALRRLPGPPAEYQNSKPDYWHGLDKPPHANPVLGQSAETLYVAADFTLGTMWSDPDTCTQLTRMQLGVRTPGGAVAFTGSAPGSYNGEPRYTSGQGTHITRPSGDVDPKTEAVYVQYAQAGPAVVCMAEHPEAFAGPMTYFSTPVEPAREGDAWVMRAGNVVLRLYGLTATAVPAELSGGKAPLKALTFPGRRSGWVLLVQAPGDPAPPDPVDRSAWDAEMKVSVRLPDGRVLAAQYRRGEPRAAATVDGTPVRLDRDWVYDGPHMRQRDGVLTVTDGSSGFRVDFSGDRPVYFDAP